MSEWQPIETAPKDGTKVLLWSEYDVDVYIGLYEVNWLDEHGIPCWTATHWMPLPKPPQNQVGKLENLPERSGR